MFIEKVLFEIYKDSAIGNCECFKFLISEYINYVDAYRLFVDITNYQIKKYGAALNNAAADYSNPKIRKVYKNEHTIKSI